MSDFLKGIVYIVNDNSRSGSQYDVERLKNTFERLNATVKIWESVDPDHQLQEIKAFMMEAVANHADFNNYQYVVVFFGSHGSWNNTVKLSCEKNKKKLCPIQQLALNPFFEIKELNGKLKWLINQSCRGTHETIQRPTDGDISIDKYFTDYFLISYSTTEGALSYRFNSGSPFIEVLCEVLDKCASDKNLLKIMEEVSEKLEKFVLQKKILPLTDPLADSYVVQVPENAGNFGNRDFSFRRGFIKKDQQEEVEEE